MTYEKTNVPGLLKDKETGAIINTNDSDHTAYQKQKESVKERQRLQKEVEHLKKQMEEQNKMIQQVLYEVGILKAGYDK